MAYNLENTKLKRSYIPDQLLINNWGSIRNFFEDLEKRNIDQVKELEKWLVDRSELEAVLEEELAWRYIKMNCDTEDEKLAEKFNFFVTYIEPEISKYTDILNRKFLQAKSFPKLDENKYFVMARAIKKRIEMFREENVPIIAELQKMEQEYGVISSKMTIHYEDKELTLQQAANYLKEVKPDVRKEVYELISGRRNIEINKFDDLLSKLIEKRHQVAKNAGYKNYKEYKFEDLGRFDYSPEDCEKFHDSIKITVLPLVENIHLNRKNKLNYRNLKPFDLDVDIDLKPPLKPFKTSKELVRKTIDCFKEINGNFAKFITTMQAEGYLDLESRKGKAPGGFNYPLYESNIPFIFMNATGNIRDVETMVHEGGHAIHSFLSSGLELVDFKSLPSEVAELASMSMELISMEHWDHFFNNVTDLKRAKLSQLEGIINVLPWIAKLDKFQNWLYENPDHNHEERKLKWKEIATDFGSSIIDWNGYEKNFDFQWQKQLHIFEVPFYYIEYGIAQLGSIAIWRNYKLNPEKTIENYMNALSLGYSTTIPEIYEKAGIEFNFSEEYVRELMIFVTNEINELRR